MENRTLQSDEIEALKAIYGSDFVTDKTSENTFRIDVKSSNDSCSDKVIGLEFQLSPDYPQTAPPEYTISAPWMDRTRKKQLIASLEKIYSEHPAESILYMWIEKTREFLSEDNFEPLENEDEPVTQEEFKSANEKGNVQIDSVQIFHGEPIMDRRSTFQAHVAKVQTVEEVKAVIQMLKENKKIATATHNLSAYRLTGGPHGTCIQDCDDDGETHAGGRLLHLLQILDVKNVVVVVSRWFGGIQLGPDRFKHINNVARDLLEKVGILSSSGPAVQGKESSNSKKKSK